jgi:hypothetical protein
MTITLAEKGGLGVRLPPRTVQSDNLTDADRHELKGLVAAVHTAPPAAGARTYDATSYTVTIDDGGEPVTLHQSDAAMTPEFGALLNWIKQRL